MLYNNIERFTPAEIAEANELNQLEIDQANERISSLIEGRPEEDLIGNYFRRTVAGDKVEDDEHDYDDCHQPASENELKDILNGGNAPLEESLDDP